MYCHLWLCLPFEESVMKFLIVYVNFSHLWSDTFSHLCFECFLIFFLLQCLTHLHNASCLDKVRQVEWRLLDTTLSLQILAFETPMPRHANGISSTLRYNNTHEYPENKIHTSTQKTKTHTSTLRITTHTSILRTTIHMSTLRTIIHNRTLRTTIHNSTLRTTIHTSTLRTTIHMSTLRTIIHISILRTTIHTSTLRITTHKTWFLVFKSGLSQQLSSNLISAQN